MMKKILVAAAIAILATTGVVGCKKQETKAAAAAPAAKSADQVAYEKAVAEAGAEKKKAAAVGGEWRDIGDFLKKADEEAKKGDYKAATALAEKAKFQAMAGQKQAKEQANVGNPSYLY